MPKKTIKKPKQEVGLTPGNLQKLIALLKNMNWCIGIPVDLNGDEEVGGLVIGDIDFLEGFPEVSIWVPTTDGLTRVESKKGSKSGDC